MSQPATGQNVDALRYPLGRYQPPPEISADDIRNWLETLRQTPAALRAATDGLNDEQLDTPYREGGWTVRQVIHHLADSHMNCYIRFRLGLTEDNPMVKTYEEADWAELPDAKHGEVEMSKVLLDSLHVRWLALLDALTADDWNRKFSHPANGTRPLKWSLGYYAWHGRHHVAQITGLKQRKGW